MVLVAMGFGLLAEGFSRDVEGAEGTVDVALAGPEQRPFTRQGWHVRRLHRPVAAVAAPSEGRADGAAPGMRHRPEAGFPLHHDTSRAAALAFDADAVRGNLWLASH